MTVPTATEREYETTILAAAAIGGWLAHAERPARSTRGWRTAIRGDAGFPDLVLVGHGKALFIELKRKPNTVTDHQARWLAALNAAGLDARVAWMPDELDELCAELIGARTGVKNPTPVPPRHCVE